MRTMTIKAATSGIRLDVLLAISIPDLSRSAAQRLLSGGFVTLPDGTSVQKSRLVNEGEVFIVDLPDPETPSAEPQDIPLDVVYEDADVIVVNKPRGMVVHPAPGHADGTLVNALLYHCGDSLSGIGGELRPGIVHRIDKDTSGLLIAAKNDFAHASRRSCPAAACRAYTRPWSAVPSGMIPASSTHR